MTDSRHSSRLGSSALLPAGHDVDASAIRPRNRRRISIESDKHAGPAAAKSASSLFANSSASASRNPSPLPAARPHYGQELRSASNPPNGRDEGTANAGNSLGLLESSLAQSWTSLQSFASSFISGDIRASQPSSRTAQTKRLDSSRLRKAPDSWGPTPPHKRPTAEELGTGALAERDAALRAAKTASILESHEGVNGGLDVTGKYKRRNSDDYSAVTAQEEAGLDQLVYIHHVQPTDTYAGIVLRYRCREEPFRRLNGLWSKDIQVRKWLALPVDFCEVKGRASQPPSHLTRGQVDHLAPTPNIPSGDDIADVAPGGDFFGLSNSHPSRQTRELEDDNPWEHVRWCSLDSFPQPVEIARVSRKAMGYFPPRRKKSLQTTSTISTPRQSLELPAETGIHPDSPERDGTGRAGSLGRRSTVNNRSAQPSTPARSSPVGTRSRMGSGGADSRPLWMRRPGGVGSMGRNVRTPGPEKDYFNTWAKRHLPGIAIDEHVPSISVMGSETAHFGFTKQGRESSAAAIVESPFDEGRDLSSTPSQGFGLDRAAAQVETWLRGAFAKGPGTPNRGASLGGRSQNHTDAPSDLIELEDAVSDGPLPGLHIGTSGSITGDATDQTRAFPASTGWAGHSGA